uniref:Reverse transcriptase zinc-binding domain-containing protein n=1 Tax=Setaria viridis TaxID=4556 RepID=A0A4U6TJ02_SETVI|nr:hypothetical protein SEVIR_8G157900v2 [Setaria viridis]
MDLESFTCELCILQRLETTSHLFLRCNFAKACWASIGVTVPTTRSILQPMSRFRQQLGVPFFMEAIILMTWSIWTTRNNWMFNNTDPTVEKCWRKFTSEFSLLLLRAKPSLLPQMQSWLDNL